MVETETTMSVVFFRAGWSIARAAGSAARLVSDQPAWYPCSAVHCFSFSTRGLEKTLRRGPYRLSPALFQPLTRGRDGE